MRIMRVPVNPLDVLAGLEQCYRISDTPSPSRAGDADVQKPDSHDLKLVLELLAVAFLDRGIQSVESDSVTEAALQIRRSWELRVGDIEVIAPSVWILRSDFRKLDQHEQMTVLAKPRCCIGLRPLLPEPHAISATLKPRSSLGIGIDG